MRSSAHPAKRGLWVLDDSISPQPIPGTGTTARTRSTNSAAKCGRGSASGRLLPRQPGVVLGCVDEGHEQPRLLRPFGQALGVPLHAEHERVTTGLDRLDDAVVGPGDRLEPSAQTVDRLVMEGVHVDAPAAGDARELAV